MYYDSISRFLIKGVLRAWERNEGQTRLLIGFSSLFSLVGIGLAAIADALKWQKEFGYGAIFVFGVSFLVLLLIAFREDILSREHEEQKIEEVESRARDNPDKPEYAWDLARTKLERYLDRNLAHLHSIFWLTAVVMLCGFGLIIIGIYKAYSNPDGLPISIVSAASGVLVSFIGGSFLLVFRSILTQSASYVTVLERINAVGMAVQITSSIPDTEEKMRSETTANLARSLLSMYATGEKKDAPKG